MAKRAESPGRWIRRREICPSACCVSLIGSWVSAKLAKFPGRECAESVHREAWERWCATGSKGLKGQECAALLAACSACGTNFFLALGCRGNPQPSGVLSIRQSGKDSYAVLARNSAQGRAPCGTLHNAGTGWRRRGTGRTARATVARGSGWPCYSTFCLAYFNAEVLPGEFRHLL